MVRREVRKAEYDTLNKLKWQIWDLREANHLKFELIRTGKERGQRKSSKNLQELFLSLLVNTELHMCRVKLHKAGWKWLRSYKLSNVHYSHRARRYTGVGEIWVLISHSAEPSLNISDIQQKPQKAHTLTVELTHTSVKNALDHPWPSYKKKIMKESHRSKCNLNTYQTEFNTL